MNPRGFQLKIRYDPTPSGQWQASCRDCGEQAEIPYTRSQARQWGEEHVCEDQKPPNHLKVVS